MILSFDPGVSNFAYSVLNHRTLELLKVGKLLTTITEANNFSQRIFFRKQIRYLLKEFSPKYVVCEAYQNRGMFRGAQVELVNLMLGIIIDVYPKLELVQASTWKNYMRRQYLTDEECKELIPKDKKGKKKKKKKRYTFEMEHLIESKTISEHEIDAVGIGLFLAERISNEKGLLWKLNDKLLNG